MQQFEIMDVADQQFGAILNNRRVTIRLRYNPTSQRWSLDLSIDNLPVLHGRRIVLGTDLLAPYNFGIGMLFALPVDAADTEAVPDRYSLPSGRVNLYHATREEFEEARLS